MLRIRAGRVHPVTAPPIEDGAVLVDGNGRISAVGAHAHIPTPPRAEALEFPEAILVPGLINCHTHLELTHLAGQNSEPDFAKWIRGVRALKDATSPEGFDAAAVAGVKDCWSRGVTCVAETGSTGAVMRALHDLGGRGIVYQEVFGPDRSQLATSMAELESAVSELRGLVTPHVRLGVSPHAPYTVSAPLYEAVAGFARRERLPVAVHLAESKEETQFVRDGTGPFADAWRARGIAVEPRNCSPVAYLMQRGVVQRETLCIHCVQVDTSDVEILAAGGVAIAHCPRSNRAHRHGTAPLGAFRTAGLRVGLGTDSVVSVGDLDLWADAAAASLDGAAALRALTLDGARALGWDRDIGSLEVGKAADLAVFPGDLRRPSPSFAALTVLAGRIVHQA
ncbi:MAG TPA: amidohydrolase family protein [Gemmatimonadales bacterium]|nr:amidohydrolase family protein [Gemmatimonadales bacterium]